MKTVIKQLVLGFTILGVSYSQVTVSGTVRDDKGAVPSGVTVEIREIVPPKSPPALPSQIHRNSITPSFTAIAAVDQAGTFSFSNLADGTYLVCAYATSEGLLSNCHWTSHYSLTTVHAADVIIPPLIMTRGTVVTFSLSDPAELLKGSPSPQLSGRLPTGHYFYPGVMANDGYYSSAHLVTQTASSKTYETTIPTDRSVRVFIDSDLTITDPSGDTLARRVPSNVTVHGGADVLVNLVAAETASVNRATPK